MKFPIQWHKETFRNYSRSLEEKKKELEQTVDRLNYEIKDMTVKRDLRAKQISTAIAKGMDGFDSEKFMIKRKKKEG